MVFRSPRHDYLEIIYYSVGILATYNHCCLEHVYPESFYNSDIPNIISLPILSGIAIIVPNLN
jgi:hypothetical protein